MLARKGWKTWDLTARIATRVRLRRLLGGLVNRRVGDSQETAHEWIAKIERELGEEKRRFLSGKTRLWEAEVPRSSRAREAQMMVGDQGNTDGCDHGRTYRG